MIMLKLLEVRVLTPPPSKIAELGRNSKDPLKDKDPTIGKLAPLPEPAESDQGTNAKAKYFRIIKTKRSRYAPSCLNNLNAPLY